MNADVPYDRIVDEYADYLDAQSGSVEFDELPNLDSGPMTKSGDSGASFDAASWKRSDSSSFVWRLDVTGATYALAVCEELGEAPFCHIEARNVTEDRNGGIEALLTFHSHMKPRAPGTLQRYVRLSRSSDVNGFAVDIGKHTHEAAKGHGKLEWSLFIDLLDHELRAHLNRERDANGVDGGPRTVADAMAARWGIQQAIDITPVMPPPLLLGRIEPTPGKVTLMHGPGSAGKGTLAASWTATLTRDGMNVLILDYEDNRATEWVPRLMSLGADMSRIRIADPINAGLRGAMWDGAEDLRALCRAWDIGLVVVDSLHSACTGHSVIDDVTADLFRRGAMRLPCPVLLIGHVTKLHEMKHTFGSVFWHNYARVTWSLSERDHATDSARLTQRKDNGRRSAGSYDVVYTYGTGGLPTDVRDRDRAILTLRERVLIVLFDYTTPTRTSVIHAAVNADGHDKVTDRSVRNALAALELDGSVVSSGATNNRDWSVTEKATEVDENAGGLWG